MKAVEMPGVKIRDYTGADVGGLSAVNLMSIARVTGTNLIDLHGALEILIVGTVVLTTGANPAAGDSDIELIPFAEDGTTQLGDPIPCGTMSHRVTAVTVKATIGLSSGGVPGYSGSCTGAIAAAGAAARALGKVKIAVNTRVAYNNATSVVFTLNSVRVMGAK